MAVERSQISTEVATREPANQNSRIIEANAGDWTNRLPRSADDLSASEIQAALGHLKDIVDQNQRSNLRNALLRHWAELDGQKAFDYVNSLDEGEIKVQAMAAVAGVMARSDPRFLAQKALALPSDRSSRELIRNLANSLAQTDAHSAFKWAEQLPEGLGREDALAIIRFQLGQQDPEEVSAQISQLPAGDSRNSLISNLATQWGTRDPAKAIEWLMGCRKRRKRLPCPFW